jgi:1,4-dihydroxy-2-naphthoate octaprenyltransferase
MRAEIPILLIPALLSAAKPADLASLAFAEGAALFFLLFNVGDMVNCLLDEDVDLHRKTHLSEAVRALGPANVKAQIAASALAALALGVHLALTLGRLWMAAAAVIGVLLGASYTAPPLRLKSRGLVQLAAYVALLFVGPMAMISGLFVPWPPPAVLLASVAYGAMQAGVLLVNNAEDLDEDEREGIRTASVALGAAGAVRAARLLAFAGAISFAAVLAVVSGPAWGALACVPLAAVAAYNDRWLRALGKATAGHPEDIAREAIRKQGKYVPRHVEAGAWASALAALAVLAARSFR